ncbi:MAG: cytochrome c1, partial [Rhodospirillales bacterium]|nr:cytochrome c1 [Rhodospirillales bacterium]
MKKIAPALTLTLALTLALTSGLILAGPASASGAKAKPPAQEWSFSGIFGTFDKAQLKRGWLVYQEICAGCHSLRLLRYRNLAEIGFSVDEVKKIAAEYEIPAG